MTRYLTWSFFENDYYAYAVIYVDNERICSFKVAELSFKAPSRVHIALDDGDDRAYVIGSLAGKIVKAAAENIKERINIPEDKYPFLERKIKVYNGGTIYGSDELKYSPELTSSAVWLAINAVEKISEELKEKYQ